MLTIAKMLLFQRYGTYESVVGILEEPYLDES
jgi:hypothetical protein